MLYNNGGIYVDMDMFALRGIDTNNEVNSLINSDEEFIGFSEMNLNTFETLMFAGKFSLVNNGMMIATKKNKVLYDMINYIINKKLKDYKNNFFTVTNATGPHIINNFLSSYKNPMIKIFPNYYFETTQMTGLSKISDQTICIHTIDNSWVDPKLKYLSKIYFTLKPYILCILIFIIALYFINKKCNKICKVNS